MPRKKRTYAYKHAVICLECRKEFKAKTKARIYCSVQCAHRAAYKRNSTNYEWRLDKLCAMAKNRAKDKGLDFDIDNEHLKALWEENNGCCALTGIPFDLEPFGDKGQVSPKAPSIDRITPKKGYTKGNVRLITYHLNVSLSDFGTDEFENLAKAFLNGGVA